MRSDDYGMLAESSGNVFADLEIPDPGDALVKAQLAHAISTLIQARRLTQTQAAQLLGVDQPKVSALMRGRLIGFSVERLLRLLLSLDSDIEILVTPKVGPEARARVTVVPGL